MSQQLKKSYYSILGKKHLPLLPRGQVWQKNPFNQKAKIFRELYLDPIHSKEQICQQLKISNATFYRMANDLNAPVYKVSLTQSVDLPKKQLLRSVKNRGWIYELEVARALAIEMGARFNFEFHRGLKSLERIRDGLTDFGLVSLCNAPRVKHFAEASIPYVFKSSAGGAIIGHKSFNLSTWTGDKKTTLGVVKGNIHELYSNEHWHYLYSIRNYSYLSRLTEALENQKVKLIFCHPLFVSDFLLRSINYEVKSYIRFPYRTVVPIRRDDWKLKQCIDKGIDNIASQGLIEFFEDNR